MQALCGEFGSSPLQRPRLFICGHVGVGKTSLSKSLARTLFESMFSNESKTDADPTNRPNSTVGVDVSVVNVWDSSNRTVQFSCFDFAGHSEYYLTHEMVLGDDPRSSVFVVLCDMSQPEPQRTEDVRLWLRFIKTRYWRYGSTAESNTALVDEVNTARPQVVLCLSKADESSDRARAGDWGDRLLQIMQEAFGRYLELKSAHVP